VHVHPSGSGDSHRFLDITLFDLQSERSAHSRLKLANSCARIYNRFETLRARRVLVEQREIDRKGGSIEKSACFTVRIRLVWKF
jgi:hypothetical protein